MKQTKTESQILKARIAKCERRIANPTIGAETQQQAVEQRERLQARLARLK